MSGPSLMFSDPPFLYNMIGIFDAFLFVWAQRYHNGFKYFIRLHWIWCQQTLYNWIWRQQTFVNWIWRQQTFMNLSLYFLLIAVFSYKRINYFSLFQKHVFIFKMGFWMSFYFQNVVLFWNVLSFSKCERFCECCFSFFWKDTILNKNLYIYYK